RAKSRLPQACLPFLRAWEQSLCRSGCLPESRRPPWDAAAVLNDWQKMGRSALLLSLAFALLRLALALRLLGLIGFRFLGLRLGLGLRFFGLRLLGLLRLGLGPLGGGLFHRHGGLRLGEERVDIRRGLLGAGDIAAGLLLRLGLLGRFRHIG